VLIAQGAIQVAAGAFKMGGGIASGRALTVSSIAISASPNTAPTSGPESGGRDAVLRGRRDPQWQVLPDGL
jgi:hypothetical protein